MNAKAMPLAKFRLGHIVTTPSALSQLTQEDILMGIGRHQAGDWGDVSNEGRTANDRALADGTRIWSAYHAASGAVFWVITEADRRTTTILLPGEY